MSCRTLLKIEPYKQTKRQTTQRCSSFVWWDGALNKNKKDYICCPLLHKDNLSETWPPDSTGDDSYMDHSCKESFIPVNQVQGEGNTQLWVSCMHPHPITDCEILSLFIVLSSFSLVFFHLVFTFFTAFLSLPNITECINMIKF